MQMLVPPALADEPGQLRDVGGLVADALQVRDHFQGGGDAPQVGGHGLLLEQELGAEGLDLPLHVVHFPVQGEDLGL